MQRKTLKVSRAGLTCLDIFFLSKIYFIRSPMKLEAPFGYVLLYTLYFWFFSRKQFSDFFFAEKFLSEKISIAKFPLFFWKIFDFFLKSEFSKKIRFFLRKKIAKKKQKKYFSKKNKSIYFGVKHIQRKASNSVWALRTIIMKLKVPTQSRHVNATRDTFKGLISTQDSNERRFIQSKIFKHTWGVFQAD